MKPSSARSASGIFRAQQELLTALPDSSMSMEHTPSVVLQVNERELFVPADLILLPHP
jgi:hypothetical protein